LTRSAYYPTVTLSLLPSFSQSSRDLPHLHSFPTRRSSDLWRSAPNRAPASAWAGARRRLAGGSETATCETASGRSAPRRRAEYRSEEHTSELQSRENLVCRLLLEKKKRKKKKAIRQGNQHE